MNKKNNFINTHDETNEKTKSTSSKEAVVFVNKPITASEKDIVGFESQISMINNAIDKGAKMIGVVADYGTGKSSVTELLQSKATKISAWRVLSRIEGRIKNGKKKSVIKINMWDSLESQSIGGRKEEGIEVGKEISDLTKSFLFQFASGKSKKFADYINRILSKNFNVVSFSTNSIRLWIFLVFAAVSYSTYLISNNKKLLEVAFDFIKPDTQLKVYFWSPLFLIFVAVFVALAISNTTIAFSNWKKQEKRDGEVNDIFSTYRMIINKLKRRKNIIVIEDLDRVDNKAVIIGFLKELYRFQNLLTDEEKKNFVFIVSIKPEVMLKVHPNLPQEYEKNIYEKVFDIIVTLKPIHFEDYESVLLSLIKNDETDRDNLEKLLSSGGEIIRFNDQLPRQLSWLIKGENLTIRLLKDRLNSAISIFVSLKNKCYKSMSAINIESCAAISYLENQYPKNYHELIVHEKALAELIESAYKIKNTIEDTDAQSYSLHNEFLRCFEGIDYEPLDVSTLVPGSIREEIKSSGSYANEFIEDMCDLILSGAIDEDFRMYFYTYPRGSYIKTTNEKKVMNFLQLPGIFKGTDKQCDELKEAMKEIGESDLKTSVVFSALRSFPKDSAMPRVVLFNTLLLEQSFRCNQSGTFLALEEETNLYVSKERPLTNIWSAMNDLNTSDSGEGLLIATLIEKHIEVYANAIEVVSAEADEYLERRKEILIALGRHRGLVKRLYVFDEDKIRPLTITKEEIDIISDVNVFINYIDTQKIRHDEFDVICNAINSTVLEEQTYNIAKKIYATLLSSKNVIEDDDYQNLLGYLIQFLKINKKIDRDFFAEIMTFSGRSKIAAYIDSIKELPELTIYFEALDTDVLIGSELSDYVLNRLRDAGYWASYLYNYYSQNALEKVSFSRDEKEIKRILVGIKKIYKVTITTDPNTIIAIRKCIIKNQKVKVDEYQSLFMGEFPLITDLELRLLKPQSKACILINKDKMFENIPAIAEHIQRTFSQPRVFLQLCKSVFFLKKDLSEQLKSEKNAVGIISDEQGMNELVVRKNLFEAIDFTGAPFRALHENYQKSFTRLFYGLLDLKEPDNNKNFIIHTQYLFSNLDQELQNNMEADAYISFINQIEMHTERTIEWVKKSTSWHPLYDELSGACFEAGLYKKYVYGKSLWQKEFTYEEDLIPHKTYVEVYKESKTVYKYMAKHWFFVQKMIRLKDYEGVETEKLKHFYPIDGQTIDFIKYLFSILNDAEKKEYLSVFGRFLTEKDSIEFVDFICESLNMELLENKNLYKHIYHNLWESDRNSKSKFTRKRNQRWKAADDEKVVLGIS